MAVQQAELFDEIDEQATRQAVRDFFFDDGFNKRSFSHILRKAGSGSIKSPSLSADGGFGGGGGNHNEDAFIAHTEYSRALNAVHDAIGNCLSEESRIILKNRFIKHEQVEDVKELLHISSNKSWHKAEKYACYEFSETIETAIAKYQVEDLFPTFTIFKKAAI